MMYTEPMLVLSNGRKEILGVSVKVEPVTIPYPKKYLRKVFKTFFVAKGMVGEDTPTDYWRVLFICNGMCTPVAFKKLSDAIQHAKELEQIEYVGDYSQKSLYDAYIPFLKQWRETHVQDCDKNFYGFVYNGKGK